MAKKRIVNVWSRRLTYAPPIPGDPPSEVHARYEGTGNKWFRDADVHVDLDYASVEDAIRMLTEAAVGLEQAHIVIDTYDDYGSTRTTIQVQGRRQATPEEVKWVKWQIAKDERDVRDRAAAEIDEFRKKHPDLMK